MANGNFGGGSGTETDPYLVEDGYDLYEVRNNKYDYFKQVANIDLNDSHPDGWVRIYEFRGHYDGGGYTIKNLFVVSTSTYAGLFGKNYGTIKNVGLINAYVYTTEDYAGLLVGSNNNTIRNCYVAGTVKGNERVGGVVGSNSGTIIQCYSAGKVYSTDTYTGGFVGSNGSTGIITQCYSTAKVYNGSSYAGGFAGRNYYGTITQCYSTGSVDNEDYSYIGGFCGQNYSGTISSCFWDTTTSGITSSNGGTGKTTAEMQDINTYLDAGWGIRSV